MRGQQDVTYIKYDLQAADDLACLVVATLSITFDVEEKRRHQSGSRVAPPGI